MNQKRIIRLKKLREEKLKDSSVIDISKNKIVIQNEVSASIKLAAIISALAAIILAGIAGWSVYKSSELIEISNEQLALTKANLDSAYIQFKLNKELVIATKDQVDINKKSTELLAAQIEQNSKSLDISSKQLGIANVNLLNTIHEKYLLYEPNLELFDIRINQELATIYFRNKNPFDLTDIRYRFRSYLLYRDSLGKIDSTMITTTLISEIEIADRLKANTTGKFMIVFHPYNDLFVDSNPLAKIPMYTGLKKVKEYELLSGIVHRFVRMEITYTRELDNREFRKYFYFRVWGFESKEKGGTVIQSSLNEIIELYKIEAKMNK